MRDDGVLVSALRGLGLDGYLHQKGRTRRAALVLQLYKYLIPFVATTYDFFLLESHN